ncbi:MAG TPA: hypothetical protein VIK91_09750 [Nannocystis sp.]
MFARTVLTLLLCTTSTVALAGEPLRADATFSGGLAPALLAERTAQDPMRDPTMEQPLYPEERTELTTPPPQNIRPPKLDLNEWQREKRKLQAQTAVSWIFTGIGAAGVATTLAVFRACREADRTRDVDCSQERQVAQIGAPIFGALTVASLIPAIVYSARLSRHNRYYSEMARIQVTPGGLLFRF